MKWLFVSKEETGHWQNDGEKNDMRKAYERKRKGRVREDGNKKYTEKVRGKTDSGEKL